MSTVYSKGYYGNQARTTIEQVVNGQIRVLEISTMKRSNGKLVTQATSHLDDGSGFLSYIMFQDYSKTIASDSVRVTAKAVQTQHESVLANIASILDDVVAYYEKAV